MKKINLLFTTLLAAGLVSSCNTGNLSNDYYVTMLASTEYNYLQSGKTKTVELKYTQYDETFQEVPFDESGCFSYAPVLKEQIVTGDTVSKVIYTRKEDKILEIDMTSDSGEYNFIFKLNDKGLADSIYNGTEFVPYTEIEYSSDSQSSLRTKVGEYELVSNSGDYTEVRKNGERVIEYDYRFDSPNVVSVPYNVLGFQQTEVPGHKYFWYSDAFGSQSRHLYKRARVVEEGEEVVYEHTYLVNQLGLIINETINRNGEQYMNINYEYATVVVNMKENK